MDGLYDTDALAWSEQQGGLLRRLAAGERLNEVVDWPNVIEEIEAMGRSELRACGSLLEQAMLHLLELRAWPESPAARHWRDEVWAFLTQARDCFTPSMRNRLDLQRRYAGALRQLRFAALETPVVPRPLPEACPFQLDELLNAAPESLIAQALDQG